VEQATAIQVWIKDLLSGSFQQEEENATSVSLPDGKIVHRVRLYGILVSTDELVVDDGTGSILVRTFEQPQNATIGDSVLVIGRPRLYQQQPFLLGEIVKKIDPKWMELRKTQVPIKEEQPTERALRIIKTLDKGEGADYDSVIQELGGEELVVHLLSIGSLFETRPGRLKVLE